MPLSDEDRSVIKATIKEVVTPLANELTIHTVDQYAHPASDQQNKEKLSILWDERNEMKGILRFVTFAMLAGPSLGALFGGIFVWIITRS